MADVHPRKICENKASDDVYRRRKCNKRRSNMMLMKRENNFTLNGIVLFRIESVAMRRNIELREKRTVCAQ